MARKRTPKPVSSATLAAITRAAAGVSVTAPTFSAGDGKAFEAWFLMETALNLNGRHTVVPCDHTGATTTDFRVSGGPSFMPSKHSKNPDEPCHFQIGTQYELHAGLRQVGRSGDSHELDVSLIDAGSAAHIRARGKKAPYDGPVYVGVELKEYSGKTLPKSFARALLGVAFDITPFQFTGPVTVLLHGIGIGALIGGRDHQVEYVLMTNSGLTKQSKKILDHYEIGYAEKMTIISPSPEIDTIFTKY